MWVLKLGRLINLLGGAILALALQTQAKADDRLALGESTISHVPGSVMVFGGVGVGREPLETVLFHPWDVDSDALDDSGFAGVAMSRQLVRFWQHFWLEAELGAGFRFEPAEDFYNPEVWGAIYLKFDGFPWNDTLRTAVGVSTGLNWVREIVPSETNHGRWSVPEGAVLQHYLSPEIAFSLPDTPEKELVFRLHHRSTGYGLFWDARTGSNVVTVGLRFRR